MHQVQYIIKIPTILIYGHVYFVPLRNPYTTVHHGKVLPKWARAHLGPGPVWARAQFGPGPNLGPGPFWARAHFGPGPILGPGARAHMGPGPNGPWPIWALAQKIKTFPWCTSLYNSLYGYKIDVAICFL